MSYYFELAFVDFDQQGEPHQCGEVSKEDRSKTELLPVLFDDGDWKGPVWKRNDKGNLEAIDHVELTRIHSYSSQPDQSNVVTSERLEAKEGDAWIYFNSEGSWRPVPTLPDGTSLREIPFK